MPFDIEACSDTITLPIYLTSTDHLEFFVLQFTLKTRDRSERGLTEQFRSRNINNDIYSMLFYIFLKDLAIMRPIALHLYTSRTKESLKFRIF